MGNETSTTEEKSFHANAVNNDNLVEFLSAITGNGYVSLVKYTNEKEQNVFHLTASRGNIKQLKTLIETVRKDSADELQRLVNSACKDGRTPLHYAADVLQCECVKELLKAGADADHQDIYGYTALHLASARYSFWHTAIGTPFAYQCIMDLKAVTNLTLMSKDNPPLNPFGGSRNWYLQQLEREAAEETAKSNSPKPAPIPGNGKGPRPLNHTPGKGPQPPAPPPTTPARWDAGDLALCESSRSIRAQVEKVNTADIGELLQKLRLAQKRLDTAAARDFDAIAHAGLALQGLQAELPLPEEAYRTIPKRHARLVVDFTKRCSVLEATGQGGKVLEGLQEELRLLRLLDLTALIQPRSATRGGKGGGSNAILPVRKNAEFSAIFVRKDHIMRQALLVSDRRALTRTITAQKAQLMDANTKKDFDLSSSLGLEIQKLKKKSDALGLTDDELGTLEGRRKGLVENMHVMCEDLAKAERYAELSEFAAEWNELRDINLSRVV